MTEVRRHHHRRQRANVTTMDRRQSASANEVPSIYPDATWRGHPQPARIGNIAQRNQSGAVCGGDQRHRAVYGHVADHKQRSKLFIGQHLRFFGHDPSMDRFGNPPWSILLSLGNKGRLRWRLSHHRVTIASARTASARVRHRALRHGRASSRGRQHGHQRAPSPRRQQRQHHDDTGSKGQRAHRHHGTRQAAPSPRPDRRRSGEAVERGTATGATGHRDSRASARAGRSRSPWGQSSRAVSPVAQSVAQTLIEPPTDTPESRRKAFIARAFSASGQRPEQLLQYRSKGDIGGRLDHVCLPLQNGHSAATVARPLGPRNRSQGPVESAPTCRKRATEALQRIWI